MKVYTDNNLKGPGYPVGYDIKALNVTVNSYVNFMLLKFSELVQKQTNIIFWCRGSSGAILAGLVASHLAIKGYNVSAIHHIKKEGEESHVNSHRHFEASNFNIVIDDFIASGSTIYSILSIIFNAPSYEYKPEIDLLLITDDIRLNHDYCKAFKNIYCTTTRNDYQSDPKNLEIERL